MGKIHRNLLATLTRSLDIIPSHWSFMVSSDRKIHWVSSQLKKYLGDGQHSLKQIFQLFPKECEWELSKGLMDAGTGSTLQKRFPSKVKAFDAFDVTVTPLQYSDEGESSPSHEVVLLLVTIIPEKKVTPANGQIKTPTLQMLHYARMGGFLLGDPLGLKMESIDFNHASPRKVSLEKLLTELSKNITECWGNLPIKLCFTSLKGLPIINIRVGILEKLLLELIILQAGQVKHLENEGTIKIDYAETMDKIEIIVSSKVKINNLDYIDINLSWVQNYAQFIPASFHQQSSNSGTKWILRMQKSQLI